MAQQEQPLCPYNVAILGCGHLGSAIARGITAGASPACIPLELCLARRNIGPEMQDLAKSLGGAFVAPNAHFAVLNTSKTVVAAVTPQQLPQLLESIADALDVERHILISVAAGVTVRQLRQMLAASGKASDDCVKRLRIVRAMPNTAAAVGESMTCLAGENAQAVSEAQKLFDCVGRCMVIDEDDMLAATALCACGIAFFCRAIRAAGQGGVEIGFHSEDAIKLAAQTALGAAMLLRNGGHPEAELDRVTTPKGCTIVGLNQMEHQGFSSAMIKGITTSAHKAAGLMKRHAHHEAETSDEDGEDGPVRNKKRHRS